MLFNARLNQIYAPWCGHCQSLEPIYNKLAKHLRNIDSLVIAKMDGTTNEHPRAKVNPTFNRKYVVHARFWIFNQESEAVIPFIIHLY